MDFAELRIPRRPRVVNKGRHYQGLDGSCCLRYSTAGIKAIEAPTHRHSKPHVRGFV